MSETAPRPQGLQLSSATAKFRLEGLRLSSCGSSILAMDDYLAKGLTPARQLLLPAETHIFFDENGYVTRELLRQHTPEVKCFFGCGEKFQGYTEATKHTLYPRSVLLAHGSSQSGTEKQPFRFFTSGNLWSYLGPNQETDEKKINHWRALPCVKTGVPRHCLWHKMPGADSEDCPCVYFKDSSLDLRNDTGYKVGIQVAANTIGKDFLDIAGPVFASKTTKGERMFGVLSPYNMTCAVEQVYHLSCDDLGFPCLCGILWPTLYDLAGHYELQQCKLTPLSPLEMMFFLNGHMDPSRTANPDGEPLYWRLYEPTFDFAAAAAAALLEAAKVEKEQAKKAKSKLTAKKQSKNSKSKQLADILDDDSTYANGNNNNHDETMPLVSRGRAQPMETSVWDLSFNKKPGVNANNQQRTIPVGRWSFLGLAH